MSFNRPNGNGTPHPLQTAQRQLPPARSSLQHLRFEDQLQHQHSPSLRRLPSSPLPVLLHSSHPSITFTQPPLSPKSPPPPPPLPLQVGQLVRSDSFNSAYYTPSSLPQHPYRNSKIGFLRPGRPPPSQSYRTLSQYSLPDTSSADQFTTEVRRTSTLQGSSAPPRNVMMMGDSGGVAFLRGPTTLQNIQDPYAVQPILRSGEIGRPSFTHLTGMASSSASSSRLNSANTSSWQPLPLRASVSSSGQHLQARSHNERRLSAALIARSSSTAKMDNPWPGSESSSHGKEGASGSNTLEEDLWKSILISTAASSLGGNDFGSGSFSASFGDTSGGGGIGGGWTGGQGNGAGGRDNGDERGQGNFGNGEGGGNNNGDGNGGSPSSKEKERAAAKKANPLVDLIETETAYVSELAKIIKKVAGAWSRSNFPPAELDTMFRNIESIYRVNRSFLKSLKEIGPNPSSPRALGDLLMRWIDDLETPYLRYCDNYFTDFDNWPSVQTNNKLPPLLEGVSESTQADGSPIIFSDKKRQPGQVWTLDQLFALPQTRLKYYKKLYSRLLKSTQSGRSDHRLLVGANEKLDELLQRAKKRITMSVLDEGPLAANTRQSQESSVGELTTATRDSGNVQSTSSRTSLSADHATSSKEDLPVVPVPTLPMERSYSPLPLLTTSNSASSSATKSPSLNAQKPSSASISPRVSQSTSDDLEARLDTSRTLDVFTLKPKKCQLRMNPPNIPFTRALRKSDDVVIYFTPSSTGQELILRRAHIFLLTDLFLVCERMSANERAERGGMADMWLLYPPLAGKHLRVADNGSLGNSITVQILKKETLIIHLGSRQAKLDWIDQFDQCNKFASSMGLKVKTNSEPDSGPVSQTGSSLLSPRDNSNTPNLSPAPSPRIDDDSDQSIIRDTARLVDEMAPFTPEEGSLLSRANSFKSFVMPPMQQASSREENGERRIVNGATSPALASTFARSPEPLSPSFPPNPLSMMNRPPPTRMPTLPPQIGSDSFGSPPMPSLSPPTGPQRMQYQGNRPGMMFRPPQSQGSMSNAGLPAAGPPLPISPPPQHLVNGVFANPHRPQPPRPTPQFSGPLPPRPPPMNGQSTSLNGRPPYLNGSGSGLPRPQAPRPPYTNGRNLTTPNEPNRRPSAPDLRSRANQEAVRRASEENMPDRNRLASNSQSGPPKLPSAFLKQAGSRPTKEEYSPPSSPSLANRGPKSSTVAAQMRCRLYLKQSHAQWKSLGNARIKVFHLMPDDVKQLVVENDKKPTPIISSIILPDGVERVGKVGVAIELSDNGNRTGIVYMIHLRSEESAFALFGQLLEGSDRTVLGAERGVA